MTPIYRSPCPDFMRPYLADVPADQHPNLREHQQLVSYRRGDSGLPVETATQLLSYLGDVFGDKCCYCQTAIGENSRGVIELFRPRGAFKMADGLKEHTYLYMSYDWRNIYLACATCSRNKGNRFPVSGSRAPYGATYQEVVAFEDAALIDPCVDNPYDHLAFLETGWVLGLSKKGDSTIKLLRLNRTELVEQRLNIVKRIQVGEVAVKSESFKKTESYSAVWSEFSIDHKYPDLQREQAIAQAQRIQNQQIPDVISTEDGIGLESYRATAQYVERIRIENFGAIQLLELDLSKSQADRVPCFALLGENGVGKSTVLRALAMALSGRAYTKRLRLTSNHFLPKNAYVGEVRVSIAGQEKELVMSLKRNRQIKFSAEKSSSIVLAYGATRLLPRGRHKPKAGERHAKIDNLFDPFLPLTDPEAWLSILDSSRIADVNTVLESLLPKDEQLHIVQDRDGVRIVLGGDPGRKIGDLSDGYQSMLGMAVDIMQVLYNVDSSIESAEGIVLIDELGNHFHPAWRLRCLSALREAFPRTQFIYSTHDPLCLRGLYEGEVAVLMRDKLRRVYAMDDLPDVKSLRVEQLLSSEHFGLRSTMDPEMEDDIKEYEVLTAKGNKSPDENDRLSLLVQKLTDVRYLGTTRREQMALQLLDLHPLPDIPATSKVSAKNLSDATVSKLQLIMKNITPAQEVSG